MIERFAEYLGVLVAHGQAGENGKVGHIASAEVQCLRIDQVRRQEFGQALLQQRMRAAMAADQVRGAAAGTVQFHALLHCFRQARMRGQAKIVVAAEGQQFAAIHHHTRRAGRFHRAALADQVLVIQRLQLPVEFCE